MLAIEVELLTGRYAATEHNDRSRAEWPPHPARLFSALVAALHDSEPVDAAERAALLWLETQASPDLDVDLEVTEACGRRDVRSVFVPVNDVTLVGTPDAALREATDRLAKLERETSSAAAATKRAHRDVEEQEAKLAAFIMSLHDIDPSPPASSIKSAGALLPDRRTRQERTFPVVIPGRSTFTFIWSKAEPGCHLEALQRLCDRVTRLGHSSSFVRCALVQRPVTPTLVPSASGEYVLRTVGPGQLDRLEDAFARHLAVETRVLPARPQRYGLPIPLKITLPSSIFSDDWILFERIGGDRPLSARGIDLARALRRSIIEVNGTEDLPEVLSGHTARGDPATAPHLAFVTLPFVGHEHADGTVQGLALVPPNSMNVEERDKLLRILARWERERADAGDGYSLVLATGASAGLRSVSIKMRRVDVSSKMALRVSRWCAPASRFVTVTPIALDRHPGNLRSNLERAAYKAAAEAEASIADSCERIGLPRPMQVSISFSPLLVGAQHVRQYFPWPSASGRPRRAFVHAEIQFSDRVKGPILVGAGRHFGLGMCLPLQDQSEAGAQ